MRGGAPIPQNSKFTQQRREIIIEALRRGNSMRTAAGMARVDEAAIRRWIKRGRDSARDSKWREFAQDVDHAIAVANGEMVEIVRRDATVEKNAKSAMWWLERRDKGFQPPQPDRPSSQQGPVVINLAFADGRPIGGEVVLEAVKPKALEQNNSA